MSLILNGVEVDTLYVNGVKCDTGYLNGVEVFGRPLVPITITYYASQSVTLPINTAITVKAYAVRVLDGTYSLEQGRLGFVRRKLSPASAWADSALGLANYIYTNATLVSPTSVAINNADSYPASLTDMTYTYYLNQIDYFGGGITIASYRLANTSGNHLEYHTNSDNGRPRALANYTNGPSGSVTMDGVTKSYPGSNSVTTHNMNSGSTGVMSLYIPANGYVQVTYLG